MKALDRVTSVAVAYYTGITQDRQSRTRQASLIKDMPQYSRTGRQVSMTTYTGSSHSWSRSGSALPRTLVEYRLGLFQRPSTPRHNGRDRISSAGSPKDSNLRDTGRQACHKHWHNSLAVPGYVCAISAFV